MINLITGLPGACKTLYTLSYVDAMAKRDSRPVFYSGITDVKLEGWTEFDAEFWYECPPGALIVIDECQRIFRPRTISKDVPKFVSELETHRHKGLDLFMITQHPMLADSALRRLAGRHVHCVRTFGLQGAMLHEWQSVKDSCDKSSGRVDSVKTRWPYNKAMFGMYKSAEIHTVKRNIPGRVKLFIALPFIIGGLCFALYSSIQKKIHPVAPTPAVISTPGNPYTNTPPSPGYGKNEKIFTFQSAKQDAAQYAFDRAPRVAGVNSSAPLYDELTKPTTVAMPVACVRSEKSGCKCFSQQATPVQVPEATCEYIVANGYFQEFDPNGSRSQAGPQGNDPGPQGGPKVITVGSSALDSSSPSRRSPGALGGKGDEASQVKLSGVRIPPPKGALDGSGAMTLVGEAS